MADIFENPLGLRRLEVAKLSSLETKKCLNESLFEVPMLQAPKQHNNPSSNSKFLEVRNDVQVLRRLVTQDAKAKFHRRVMKQRSRGAGFASNAGSTSAKRAPAACRQKATS